MLCKDRPFERLHTEKLSSTLMVTYHISIPLGWTNTVWVWIKMGDIVQTRIDWQGVLYPSESPKPSCSLSLPANNLDQGTDLDDNSLENMEEVNCLI